MDAKTRKLVAACKTLLVNLDEGNITISWTDPARRAAHLDSLRYAVLDCETPHGVAPQMARWSVFGKADGELVEVVAATSPDEALTIAERNAAGVREFPACRAERVR